MRRSSKPLFAFLVLALTSCGLLKPPTALDHDARQLMEHLRHDRLESALAMLRSTEPIDTLRKYLTLGRDFIRPFPSDSIKLIGWNVVQMADTTGTLTYEAHGAGRTAVLVATVIRGRNSAITAFHWQETPKPLATVNAFTFRGKTAKHFLYLTLAVLSVLACLGGAIFAGLKRVGIPWVLICIIGLPSFSINWTTGKTLFEPASFHVFGAGIVKSGEVAPWIVSWSVPLGTILMLIVWTKRRRARTKMTEEPQVPELQTPK